LHSELKLQPPHWPPLHTPQPLQSELKLQPPHWPLLHVPYGQSELKLHFFASGSASGAKTAAAAGDGLGCAAVAAGSLASASGWTATRPIERQMARPRTNDTSFIFLPPFLVCGAYVEPSETFPGARRAGDDLRLARPDCALALRVTAPALTLAGGAGQHASIRSGVAAMHPHGRLEPDPFDERLRHELAAALRRHDAGLAAVARALHTSARSLQRKLAAGGRTYRVVRDELRCALARACLADPELAISETAFLLGFSDASAFHRAFKRWTGSTAGAFRRAALSRRSGAPA
jgi:AraC-like DNA-binding protein